jgi:hypothetical protein
MGRRDRSDMYLKHLGSLDEASNVCHDTLRASRELCTMLWHIGYASQVLFECLNPRVRS